MLMSAGLFPDEPSVNWAFATTVTASVGKSLAPTRRENLKLDLGCYQSGVADRFKVKISTPRSEFRRPSGTQAMGSRTPAINRRATVICPSGTRINGVTDPDDKPPHVFSGPIVLVLVLVLGWEIEATPCRDGRGTNGESKRRKVRSGHPKDGRRTRTGRARPGRFLSPDYPEPSSSNQNANQPSSTLDTGWEPMLLYAVAIWRWVRGGVCRMIIILPDGGAGLATAPRRQIVYKAPETHRQPKERNAPLKYY
jgi:hypothetical protein